MKNSLKFKALLSFFATLCLILFQGCSKSGDTDEGGNNSEEDAPTLTISTTSLSFDADGNSTDGLNGLVSITTNGYWTTSIDASNALTSWGWSFDTKSGTGDGEFTLSLAATEDARTATITVSAYTIIGGETVTKDITVTQSAVAAATNKSVKVSELVALMEESTYASTFGSEYNYILSVVVSKVIDGVVYAQESGSTDAGEGIAIVGDNLAASYSEGDELTVTLEARTGAGYINNGAPQLTYSTLTVDKGSNTTVAPIVVSASDLNANAYVNMYVTLENVTSSSTGTWTTGTADGSHTFDVSGTTIKALVPMSTTELVGAGYTATTGSMSGIGGTSGAEATLVINCLADVIDFELSAPTIESVSPESYQFPVAGGDQTFTITGSNLKGGIFTVTGLSSQYSYSYDSTTDNPTITISALENTTGADLAAEVATISVEDGNSIDISVSQDDGYMSIPEVIDLINIWGGSAETDYTGDFSFKFKAIVSATVNDGAYNLNKGQFSLVTENCTEPGNGLIFSLGSGYTTLLYSYDFTLGDEVEIEIFPATAGTTVTASDGTTRSQGVRMNNTSYPLLVAFDSDCATVTKTGRTGIEVPVPTIDPTEYYSYEAMLVKMELTTTAAGTLSTSTNQTHWIFSNTVSGSYTVSFKTGNTSECIFLGKSYIATTAEATGIALSYQRTSAYFEPQTLEHFANFLAE